MKHKPFGQRFMAMLRVAREIEKRGETFDSISMAPREGGKIVVTGQRKK